VAAQPAGGFGANSSGVAEDWGDFAATDALSPSADEFQSPAAAGQDDEWGDFADESAADPEPAQRSPSPEVLKFVERLQAGDHKGAVESLPDLGFMIVPYVVDPNNVQ